MDPSNLEQTEKSGTVGKVSMKKESKNEWFNEYVSPRQGSTPTMCSKRGDPWCLKDGTKQAKQFQRLSCAKPPRENQGEKFRGENAR